MKTYVGGCVGKVYSATGRNVAGCVGFAAPPRGRYVGGNVGFVEPARERYVGGCAGWTASREAVDHPRNAKPREWVSQPRSGRERLALA